MWIIAFVMIVPAAFVACSANSSRPTQGTEAKPSLNLSSDVCELGRTSLRKRWRVPFRIGNSGEKRLVMNRVDAACCGDSTSDTIIILPGQVVDVSVSLDTRFVIGAVQSVTCFTTSDPDRPRLELTVRALVAEDERTFNATAAESS